MFVYVLERKFLNSKSKMSTSGKNVIKFKRKRRIPFVKMKRVIIYCFNKTSFPLALLTLRAESRLWSLDIDIFTITYWSSEDTNFNLEILTFSMYIGENKYFKYLACTMWSLSLSNAKLTLITATSAKGS